VAIVVAGWMVWGTAPGAGRRRVAGVLGGAMLGTLGSMAAVRWAYYGELVPNTYWLKLSGVALGIRLERGLVTAAKLAPTLAIAAAGGFLVWRRAGARPRQLVVLLAATGLAVAAYSVWVGGDAWEYVPNRYVAPFLVVAAVLAMAGFEGWRGEPRGRLARASLGGAALLLWALGVATVEVSWGWRLAVLAPALLLVAAFLLLPARRLGRWPGLPVALAAAAMLVSTSGVGFLSWALLGGHHVEADRRLAEEGRALARLTAPAARVAVVWAGAPVYYSERPAIDLLGKSDPVIARAPRRGTFRPGHDRWDYAYSILELRPDVVHQLWEVTPEEWAAIGAAGYELHCHRVHGTPMAILVRADSAHVDRAALEAC
jgi:arabinofuranosyltransferase